MMRKPLWIGLDVGADLTTVCGTDEQGSVVFEQTVDTTAATIHSALKAHKSRISLIGLEAGSFGLLLTRSLRKLGYPVAMFESRQASKFLAIRQNKTDRNDAKGLADIARIGREAVSEVRVKSQECQRLKSALVTRHRIVRLRVATDSTMRSLFRLNGGQLKTASSTAALKKNVRGELKRVRKLLRIDLTEDIEPLLNLSLAARSYLEALDKKLTAQAHDNAVCQRFLEIPGIGPICALTFYCTIEDPLRFQRSADVGPYLGMVPKVRQTGNTTTKLRISKMGDAMTRGYLTTAALSHLRYGDTGLSLWGKTLGKRIGKRRAVTAVARKLAVTMIAMWKQNSSYDFGRGLAPGAAGLETVNHQEDSNDPADGVLAKPADAQDPSYRKLPARP